MAYWWRRWDARGDLREDINFKGADTESDFWLIFILCPRACRLAHFIVAINMPCWEVPPPVFFPYIGPYKYKTSAFVTGKCHLKVKSAGGTCQDGVNMVSKWRIFGHAHWKKNGTSFNFTRVGRLVDLYSVTRGGVTRCSWSCIALRKVQNASKDRFHPIVFFPLRFPEQKRRDRERWSPW